MIDDIVFRFSPFTISRFPWWATTDSYRLQVDKKCIVGADDSMFSWGLADVLVLAGSNKAVGLSFAVNSNGVAVARNLVAAAGDTRVRMTERGPKAVSGDCGRLDILWAATSESLEVWLAQCYYGVWLVEPGFIGGEAPFGYWLQMVDGMLEDNGLTWGGVDFYDS